jgi:copper chaperone CopZ
LIGGQEDEVTKYIMTISDMDCAHCAEKVETALKEQEGTDVRIDLEKRQATVLTTADAESLIADVTCAGFTVSGMEIAES